MKKTPEINDIFRSSRRLMRLAFLACVVMLLVVLIDTGILRFPEKINEPELIKDTPDSSLFGVIDEESGLVVDEGFEIVKSQCGACHSTKLVAQNRFSRKDWEDLIRWMQREQRLWDLGENEKPILDYLEKHQAPLASGRRINMGNIEWYVLEE